MPKSLNKLIFVTVLIISVSGCATVAVDTGYRAADDIVSASSFKKEYIKTGLSTLTAFYNFTRPGAPLTVYIEGDGAAWRSRRELSDDPTPRNPLVLSLAAIDPSENVAYLARPGQLTENGNPDCDPAYWSEKRFSPEVVNAVNSAIDHLKAESGAKEINMVGYSGGAAIAILASSRRADVVTIRTIAGNLDTEAVNRYNEVSELSGSLNPIDAGPALSKCRMRHFTGSDDEVVPPFIAEHFAAKAGDSGLSTVTLVRGASHSRGWKERWKDLLKIPL